MPRCACVGGTCNCLIKQGPGATVTGNGTAGNPYIVSADGATNLEIRDTDTIDLTLDGDGTAADPFILRGDAVLALDELTDVDAPTPGNGQTLVYDMSTATWKPGTPAAAGGALQVQDTATLDLTLTGTGAPATPYVLKGDVIGGTGQPIAGVGKDITGWTLQDSTIVGTLALAHPYQVDRHVVWNFTATVNLPFVTTANGQLTPALQIATISDVNARPRTNTTISWSNGSTLWGMGIINTDGTVVLQTCNRLSLNAAAGQAVRVNASWVAVANTVPLNPWQPSGVWGQGGLLPVDVGTDSTKGNVVYIDSNGQLRALPNPTKGLVAPYQQSAAYFSMQGGWVLNSGVRMLRYGPIVQLYWNMSPPSDINMTSTGDIGNITCAILAGGVPPPLMAGHMWHGTFSGGGAIPVGAVSTAGNITIGATQIGTGTAWSAGAGRDYGCMYFAALDAP